MAQRLAQSGWRRRERAAAAAPPFAMVVRCNHAAAQLNFNCDHRREEARRVAALFRANIVPIVRETTTLQTGPERSLLDPSLRLSTPRGSSSKLSVPSAFLPRLGVDFELRTAAHPIDLALFDRPRATLRQVEADTSDRNIGAALRDRLARRAAWYVRRRKGDHVPGSLGCGLAPPAHPRARAECVTHAQRCRRRRLSQAHVILRCHVSASMGAHADKAWR